MSRAKKESPVQVTQQKVKVLSQRLGDIQLKEGVVLCYQEILELDADVAQDLIKSFPGELRVL